MIFEKIQLESDEEVLSMVRRHWFFLFLHGAPLLILAGMPVVGGVIALTFFNDGVQTFLQNFAPHFLFVYATWLLVVWMLFASVWTDYYLDIWCVTNRRIIKIDQIALFRRKTGSFRLERMQDVNVEINGVIATLLDYGTVHVQTASADLEEFKGDFLPKPQEIKATILKAGDVLIEQIPKNQNV